VFCRRNPNPCYGHTCHLAAPAVRAAARAASASTYAAMVWAYHRALLGIDAFRTRLQGEDVVLYDSLRIGLTVPAPDRRFTFATLEWQEDARAFLARASEIVDRAEQGVDLGSGDAPDFAYYTALPKVPFTHFTHVALADPTAGQPEAAFGRFRDDGGRTLVPVGVLVNHLYVDGADLGDLYEAARDSFARAF
jgi:chloramphenicol O-acetyltransferase type A